ncbi:hypothetical protein BGX31_003003, partial [Mortierella sp. GBA43]
MNHSPLFQVMFTWDSNEASEWKLPGIEAVEPDLRYDIAKFDLTLGLYETGDEIRGGFIYSTALFDELTMVRHLGYLSSLLKAMTMGLNRPTAAIDILAESERNLLRTWNSTQQDYSVDMCIHYLFEQQARQRPMDVALVLNDQSLTYTELNERANRLAHHLIELGVNPDTFVAICVGRSIAMAIGVLAILKAGGAYVPLDPTYASERLQDILLDADPKIVIADESGRVALGENGLSSRIVVHPNAEVIEGYKSILDCPVSNPNVPELTPDHLTYIIYTSGSTGKPKGVMIDHKGVVNMVMTRPAIFGTNASTCVAQFFSFGFDGSAIDIFMTLCLGGSLHLLPDDIRSDPVQLWNYLQRHSISQVTLTPTVLQNCRDLSPLPALQTLGVAGEAAPAALIHALQSLVPNGKIVNDYGPTETTVSAIAWECPPEFSSDTVPIGRPVGNKKIYLLNEHRLPVPLGVVGELYIGGIGVARGYLNRPDLTDKVFLADPFSEDGEGRMYKTGDLGRYLPDGNLLFLGRNDHQVKIRGFRIELGEIESRLSDHPLVNVVTVIAAGDGSDKKLVAYVVARKDDDLVRTLKSYLTSCLPDYMVPAAIVRLDSLPLTSNGKIDRKALPEPDRDAFDRQVYEEPQGLMETTVAQIWSELLNVDRVSRNDNFFALGGHSLLAVRLMNRIATLGAQLPLSAVFASPYLSSFAECVKNHLDEGENSLAPIASVSREGYLPLSFPQQRMWFLAQMEGVSETYHVPAAIRLHGDVNHTALQRALDTIFARHEALRSIFVNVDGNPQVRLLDPHSGVPIRWEDLRGRQDAETELDRMTTDE